MFTNDECRDGFHCKATSATVSRLNAIEMKAEGP